MNKLKLIGLAFGALGLMAWATGCTKQTATSSSNTAASAAVYQNPTVSCQVNNNGTSLLNISNLTSASNYSTPPQAPAAISINCNGSQSHSNTPLTLTYSVNGGPMTAFSGGLQDSNDPTLNFSSHGLNTITIVASDGTGLSTTVNFSLPVSCNPSNPSTPNISAGPTGLSVSQGSYGEGYANVAFSGGPTGGVGPYEYAIDLNGDGAGVGRFDYYTPANSTPIYWNTSSSWQNMYNFDSGSRTIYVQVYDTTCQYMKTFSYPYDWSTGILAGAQTGPMTTIPPTESYFYLQGNVAPASGSTDTDPADTVTPFDARESGLNPNTLHVICNWADQGGATAPTQGAFSIQAINTYSDGVGNDASQLAQSMTMSWTIPENGSTTIGPQTVPINAMTYQTSASPGGAFNQYSYSMDSSGCSAYVQVTRVQSPTTCAGQSNNGYTWGNATIQGTFSCPDLVSQPNGSSSIRHIGINNGYFYCQTGPGDNCVGGGQEGGTPPTAF